MAKGRGRPSIPDETALRRVAEHIVAAEEKGTRCSIRAAILQTSGRVTGNSSDAMLWRLQRKWRHDGPALLAEARQRNAIRRNVASVPMRDGLLGGSMSELMGAAHSGKELMHAARAARDEIERMCVFESELLRTHRLQDEIARMAHFESEVLRAHRLLCGVGLVSRGL